MAPLFVAEGRSEPTPILSLPGHFQHTVASLVDEVKALQHAGVNASSSSGYPRRRTSEVRAPGIPTESPKWRCARCVTPSATRW